MPFDIESSVICNFHTLLNYSISPCFERVNVQADMDAVFKWFQMEN